MWEHIAEQPFNLIQISMCDMPDPRTTRASGIMHALVLLVYSEMGLWGPRAHIPSSAAVLSMI